MSSSVTPVAVAAELHRMTVDEYVQIVRDLGWQSTELVEGVVYDVTPELNRHADTVMDLLRRLDRAFPGDVVRNTGSVEVSDRSMFDPDIYVIDGSHVRDPDRAVPAAAVKLVPRSPGLVVSDRGSLRRRRERVRARGGRRPRALTERCPMGCVCVWSGACRGCRCTCPTTCTSS